MQSGKGEVWWCSTLPHYGGWVAGIRVGARRGHGAVLFVRVHCSVAQSLYLLACRMEWRLTKRKESRAQVPTLSAPSWIAIVFLGVTSSVLESRDGGPRPPALHPGCWFQRRNLSPSGRLRNRAVVPLWSQTLKAVAGRTA